MFGGGFRVSKDDWEQMKRDVAEIKELRKKQKESEEVLRDLLLRWNRIFPITSAVLEADAIAKIQEELGVPRLVQEAQGMLRLAIQERSRKLLEEAMQDTRWKAMLDDIRDDIDSSEIERRLAEVLSDWAKSQINIQELAAEVAKQLVEGDNIDLEEIEERLVEVLQERLSVTCTFEK